MNKIFWTESSWRKKKRELRRKLCLKSEQRKTRVYSFRKKQHVAKISKMRNNAKKIEDDEVRIQRCDENYSQIDLMHQFIFQKLESLEKLMARARDADKHAVEQ